MREEYESLINKVNTNWLKYSLTLCLEYSLTNWLEYSPTFVITLYYNEIKPRESNFKSFN